MAGVPKFSPIRRWARILVWTTLFVVGALRVLFPPEPPQRFQQGGPGDWGRRGRWNRSAFHSAPPQSPVPADFPRLTIEIDAQGVKVLRRYFWNGWGGEVMERESVPATVREGDLVYTNVAIHLKGSAGSFQPFDSGKPAFTLNFSKNAPGQKFHGLTKISLNNSVQDESYLSEKLCRELFLEAGIPVPTSTHATVIVNGRDLGLYVMVEGWTKGFLKRHFPDTDGNLYEGGFLQDFDGSNTEAKSGEHPEDRSDLLRLEAATAEPNPRARWEKLQGCLDVDRFIAMLAMESLTCHWDGYSMNRNNYRIFHDRSTGRLVFMPHGLDQMFGSRRASPTSPILPAFQGSVARAVVSVPEGRKRFLERIATLRTNVLDTAKVTNRVQQLARSVRPTLAAYSEMQAQAFDREVDDLITRIVERAESVTQQLASPPEAIEFDAEGVARLSGWLPRVTNGDRGALRFPRGEHDGRRVLGIAPRGEGGLGSWRTRLTLAPGQYRFEGRVLTTGMGAEGGVALRISGQRVGLHRPDQGTWTQVSFPIAIEDDLTEVELVCEFGADSGEAWFEEGSLRVVRIGPDASTPAQGREP
ncbi:MAG: CotH kinase family protein [Verrucomicrobiales bacterium]|nr:CotH kinase family protein [Verrucomicrobiales bacterium]